MADVTTQLRQAFSKALGSAFGEEYADADPLLNPAGNPKFGDFQANLAMKLGKQLGKPPREVAQAVANQLETGDASGGLIEKVEVAGPGFINLHLSNSALAQAAEAMLGDGRLGVAPLESPQTVVVDYSSPNVAKEMHVGHLRSTVIGDAIARVLTFQGHNVIRQNHLGDWGTQFGRVMLGLWYDAAAKHFKAEKRLEQLRLDTLEAKRTENDEWLGRLVIDIADWHRHAINEDPDGELFFEPYVESDIPNLKRIQDLYAFASAVAESEQAKLEEIDHPKHGKHALSKLPSLFARFVQQEGDPANSQEKTGWKETRSESILACQQIYDRLGVLLIPDDIRGESFYNDKLAGVIERLKSDGALQVSQGAGVVPVEGFTNKDGEPLPMIVQKADGGYLYATTDLAAALYRVDELKADRIVYVVGAPQRQHFDMLFATLRKYGWVKENVRLDFVPFGQVLGEDGKIFRTRSGETVRLVDLIDEAESRAIAVCKEKNPDLAGDEADNVGRVVGLGALKYADLSSDRIKDYKFSWDRMLALEGNTAPYLINAYVRVHGIFRKGEIDFDAFTSDHVQVDDPNEKALVLKLMQFGATVESVADSLEPHRLCNYLYELASAFHKFFEHCPVLRSDVPDDVRQGRLALCKLVALTLRQGLDLLGIGVVERM